MQLKQRGLKLLLVTSFLFQTMHTQAALFGFGHVLALVGTGVTYLADRYSTSRRLRKLGKKVDRNYKEIVSNSKKLDEARADRARIKKEQGERFDVIEAQNTETHEKLVSHSKSLGRLESGVEETKAEVKQVTGIVTFLKKTAAEGLKKSDSISTSLFSLMEQFKKEQKLNAKRHEEVTGRLDSVEDSLGELVETAGDLRTGMNALAGVVIRGKEERSATNRMFTGMLATAHEKMDGLASKEGLEKATAKNKAEIDLLRRELSDQLSKGSKQAEDERALLQSGVSDLGNRFNELSFDVKASKKSSERVEGLLTSLIAPGKEFGHSTAQVKLVAEAK